MADFVVAQVKNVVFSPEVFKSMFNLSHLNQVERDWLGWDLPLIAIPIYLGVIFLLWLVMINQKPMTLAFFKALHNAFLCLLSFAMATMTSYYAWKLYQTEGLKGIYCDDKTLLTITPADYADPLNASYSAKLWFWCAVFYYSKYYELFDTVLLALCKKQLTFLHIFHHSIIIVLCLVFMQQRLVFFFSGVIINATIHTFMYYYYSIASYGHNVWWKKYLTKGQIIQFIWGFTSWWPFLYFCTGCSKQSIFVWYFNQFVLFSFLVLFLNFYRSTYRRPSSAGGKSPAARKEAVKKSQ
eukprot:TRINITY_DN5446_c0_g1_i2.p1 TRINITY_DN5446_c0_g1~~TRINITY_DN5446_c0_g1_i2.p1  ORF type:complete len:297 (+),score=75.95 TRINITY_DN5446_c0_g1_i2:94-984(+)